jgi:hypothetical protein
MESLKSSEFQESPEERERVLAREFPKLRAAYALDETLLPAGEEAPLRVPPVRTPTFAESWKNYKEALYAIHTAVSLAATLLRAEGFRTPVGGRAWDTLHDLAEKVNRISEALGKEIDRVPKGERGLVE